MTLELAPRPGIDFPNRKGEFIFLPAAVGVAAAGQAAWGCVAAAQAKAVRVVVGLWAAARPRDGAAHGRWSGC